MSYILDALRRADAERERGSVPGLHAQPASARSASAGPATDGTLQRWLIATAVLLALALLGWIALRRPEAAVPLAATPLAAAPAPAPAAVLPSAAPAPLQIPAPAPAAAPRSVPPRVVAASAPVRPAAVATARASGVAVDARVPELKELPDEVRREVPPLTIGGASYSANAASRMLIINGQIFHEGDTVAPNHVLEQISLKSAVLRFKGTRYGIAY